MRKVKPASKASPSPLEKTLLAGVVSAYGTTSLRGAWLVWHRRGTQPIRRKAEAVVIPQNEQVPQYFTQVSTDVQRRLEKFMRDGIVIGGRRRSLEAETYVTIQCKPKEQRVETRFHLQLIHGEDVPYKPEVHRQLTEFLTPLTAEINKNYRDYLERMKRDDSTAISRWWKAHGTVAAREKQEYSLRKAMPMLAVRDGTIVFATLAGVIGARSAWRKVSNFLVRMRARKTAGGEKTEQTPPVEIEINPPKPTTVETLLETPPRKAPGAGTPPSQSVGGLQRGLRRRPSNRPVERIPEAPTTVLIRPQIYPSMI